MGKNNDLRVTDRSLEKIAKTVEERGYAVDRERGDSIYVYGESGMRGRIKVGTPWETVFAVLKAIGVIVFLVAIVVALFGVGVL